MKYPYTIMDVFTKERLKGNPLAVVFDADNLTDDQMQQIAQEFNLSETVFIRRPKTERHLATLRIFTPSSELPFAGHPTVGAAVLLGLKMRTSAIRLDEQVGTIVAITEKSSKVSGHARFGLPQIPHFVEPAPETARIAETLGLAEGQIGCGELQPAVYSAGVPFVLVPVADATALSRIQPERRGWDTNYNGVSAQVYAFTVLENDRQAQFAARAFVELKGLDEDAATGSAAAALCGLLSDFYFDADGLTDFVIRQGVEMGRTSYIEAQIRKEEGTLTHAGIGGHAIIIAEGTLNFEDPLIA